MVSIEIYKGRSVVDGLVIAFLDVLKMYIAETLVFCDVLIITH
jgi:hypothetical protein